MDQENEPGADDVRIKTELEKLPWTIGGVGALALLIFAFLPTDMNSYGDLRFGSLPTIIGRTIGSLILPGLICLVFKRKARAFKILWILFMALSLAGLYAQYVIEPNSR